MSTTTTETQSSSSQPSQAPELTVLTRVASIPMISSSLVTLNDTLSSNSYTRYPYTHAKGLSTTAYKLTEPLQVRLAPIIVRADNIANKAMDVVESRYPYPFRAQPDEVQETVSKAINEKVTTPAYNVAHGIDQRFAPLVDYFESKVKGSETTASDSEGTSPAENDAQFQYQRALALSKVLRSNIVEYTQEQLKHLQDQNSIVQKASRAASSITASSYERISILSDNMLSQLRKLQEASSSFTTSLSGPAIQSRMTPIRHSYEDLAAALSSSVNELTTIMAERDTSPKEKATRIIKEVHERVNPLLDSVKKGVSDVLARSNADSHLQSNGQNSTVNGNGNAAPANGNAHPPAKQESD